MPVPKSKLNDLKKEIPYHYKPQTIKYGKALMVGYIDNRDVMDLLDEVVGVENWTVDYFVLKDQMFARLGIYVDFEDKTPPQWIYKCDTGTEALTEEEKSQVSDAMKRSAVHFGIGRFLYRLGIVELKTTSYKDKEKPCTDDGRILWSPEEITQYILAEKIGKKPVVAEKATPEPVKSERYSKVTKPPEYTQTQFTQETVNRVNKLKAAGKEGKEALKHFMTDFNKSNKSTYKSLTEMDDTSLNKLITFIETKEKKPEVPTEL